LIEKFFLTNNHRVTYQLIPDDELNDKKAKITGEFLSSKLESLSEKDKKEIEALTLKLEKRQNSVDNPDLLPCVTVSDISKERHFASGHRTEEGDRVKYNYQAGTNGIDYTTEVFPLMETTFDDLTYSNLFSDIVTSVGVNGNTYEEIQHRQSMSVGGIGFSLYILPEKETGKLRLSGGMHGHALQENLVKLKSLMKDTINDFRLDELKRIEELTEFDIAGREKSITQSGHLLAMSSASAQLSLFGAVSEWVGGVSSIHNLKSIRDNNGRINLDVALGAFNKLKSKLSVNPSLEVLISARENKKSFTATDKTGLESLSYLSNTKVQKDEFAWITASDVNFCSQAFPSVDYSHEDAPSLSVLSAVLRNGFLHSAIREKGGAYGSGAQQDSATQTFRFFSYRDPNCTQTFEAFNNSIEWALKSITAEKLEEGILGVVSSIDKPGSPAGEARSDFNQNIKGITQDLRKAFRKGVIECSVEKLQKVTNKYLTGTPKRAVISGKKFEKELETLGFSVRNV
jgi:Zn-dependent M16 (insulinase) family peptidase